MTAKITGQAGEPKKKVIVEKKMSLFGQSIAFAQAFPMLADLKATIWVRVHGSTEKNPPERHFSLGDPPAELIHCPRTGCMNGGWPLGNIVRDMIAKRETHRKVEGKCTGRQWVTGPAYRDCATHFSAEIELTYEPD
ncbi:MAG TPA: hypothetical protein VK742_06025 [Candidatus Sulfotelmatobacter sp.]|nr:hypothetical protein [Candidatus Sulfotelmatobacter sp.]